MVALRSSRADPKDVPVVEHDDTGTPPMQEPVMTSAVWPFVLLLAMGCMTWFIPGSMAPYTITILAVLITESYMRHTHPDSPARPSVGITRVATTLATHFYNLGNFIGRCLRTIAQDVHNVAAALSFLVTTPFDAVRGFADAYFPGPRVRAGLEFVMYALILPVLVMGMLDGILIMLDLQPVIPAVWNAGGCIDLQDGIERCIGTGRILIYMYVMSVCIGAVTRSISYIENK